MERDGRIVRRAVLPTPTQHADPLERQSAPGGLVGFARVAVRLGVDACPEGMPDRCSGPLHEGVAEEGRTREAPVDPALLATPFRDRGHARALLECSGRRRAFALCAEGDEEAGSEDRASAWKGLEQGKVGMALGARRAGVVEVLDRGQGDTELVDEGVHEPHMGGDDARISGQGDGSLDGVEALGKNLRRAHRVLAKEGLQGRAAGQLGRLQGGPAAENVTNNDRVLVLQPLERLRDRVFQGARETMGAPHVVSNDAPAVVDAWCQTTPGGARRIEGRQRVAVRAEPCTLQGGGGGVILRTAGGTRVAVSCEGQGMDGQEHEEGVCA